MNDKEQETQSTQSEPTDAHAHVENKAVDSTVDDITDQVKHEAKAGPNDPIVS